MTEHEYWHQDPNLIYACYKSYMLDLHQRAHIQGLYDHIAVSTAIANALRKKGAKLIPYIEKPIEIFKEKKSKQEMIEEYKEGSDYQTDWINELSSNK